MSRLQRIIPIRPAGTAAVTPPAASPSPGIAPAARIQARAVSGVYTRWRWALVVLTQAVFYGLPWLNRGSRQAVWFDLEGRRFFLFDAVLLPQDLVLLTGLLIFSALLLFAATALVGRVWCGFACPQTVYTSLFLWIEQHLEGDRRARLRLDAAPWGPAKLLRRGGKHLAWGGLALWTGLTLVGWFTPIRSLALAVPTFSLGPWELFWTLFYAAATYVHAGLLREKLCQHACPYGRFQASMLDPATRVIAYDTARGEPRGARARGVVASSRGQGDCVDCTLCVQVCPVGIDIRQGLQAACISCGLCIDACNQVMDRLQSPRGLIGFRPMSAPAGAAAAPGAPGTAWQRPRVLAYATGLAVVATALAWGWAQRPELRLNVLRDRAVLARLSEDGAVENVYRLQLMNASPTPRRVVVSAVANPGQAQPLALDAGRVVDVAPAGTTTTVLTLRLSARQVQQLARQQPATARVVPIRIEVHDSAHPPSAYAVAASTLVLH